MTVYVASRMATGVDYAFYKKGPSGLNEVYKTITINGGADVINKKTLETPHGIVTSLSDEDFDLLKSNAVFQEHLKNGCLNFYNNYKAADNAEKTLTKDNSKQLTPEDYKKQGKRKPKTTKDKDI